VAVAKSPCPRLPPGWLTPNVALQRTPATGLACSALDAHLSVHGSAKLGRYCVRRSLGKGEETHEANRKPFVATLWVINPTR